jgi:hypothetical protein
MRRGASILIKTLSERGIEWAPAAALFACTAVFALRYHYPILYFDHWDLVLLYQRMDDGTLRLGDLFAPHGTHWHAGGYAVMLALAPLTGMTQGPEVFASLALALAAFVALFLMTSAAWRSRDLWNPALLFVVIAFFLFSPDQSENWLWGWQVSVFLNIAGAAAMLALLARERPTHASLLLAMLAAAIAIYSFATGLALLPAGLVVLWLKRPKFDVSLAAWAIFCVAITLHFKFAVMDTQRVYAASITPHNFDAATLGSLIGFTTGLLGGAVARFSDGLPFIAVLIGLAVGGFSFWRMSVSERSASAGFVGLALYGLGAAMLIALGRLGFDNAGLSRYITFANLFWIGIVGLAFISLKRPPGRILHQGARVLFCLLIVAKAITIGNVLGGSNAGIAHAAAVKRVAEDICRTYPNVSAADRDAIAAPYQHVDARLAYAAAHRLSVFHDCPQTRGQ